MQSIGIQYCPMKSSPMPAKEKIVLQYLKQFFFLCPYSQGIFLPVPYSQGAYLLQNGVGTIFKSNKDVRLFSTRTRNVIAAYCLHSSSKATKRISANSGKASWNSKVSSKTGLIPVWKHCAIMTLLLCLRIFCLERFSFYGKRQCNTVVKNSLCPEFAAISRDAVNLQLGERIYGT